MKSPFSYFSQSLLAEIHGHLFGLFSLLCINLLFGPFWQSIAKVDEIGTAHQLASLEQAVNIIAMHFCQ
jgi:hypothetical protein